MKRLLLESKHCKNKGYYFSKTIPVSIHDEDYLSYGVPFKFGYSRRHNQGEYLAERIDSSTVEFVIHSYRDLGFKVDDVIRLENEFFHITDVSVSYEEYQYMRIKRFFITLK